MPIVAMGFSCRDKDHRRALQSLLSGKLPRADRHHLGLRSRLDAVLPDGRAAARGVDEAASRRAPGGMALRDRQTGWQRSLGWKAAFLESTRPIRSEASSIPPGGATLGKRQRTRRSRVRPPKARSRSIFREDYPIEKLVTVDAF